MWREAVHHYVLGTLNLTASRSEQERNTYTSNRIKKKKKIKKNTCSLWNDYNGGECCTHSRRDNIFVYQIAHYMNSFHCNALFSFNLALTRFDGGPCNISGIIINIFQSLHSSVFIVRKSFYGTRRTRLNNLILLWHGFVRICRTLASSVAY
jgi:hypothetical protein